MGYIMMSSVMSSKGFSMIIMMSSSMSRMMIIMNPIFFIFRSTDHKSLIPSCLYKDLKCRVQMYDHNKENKANNSKDRKKKNPYFHNGKERYDTRYNKGKNKKKECHENRPKIEKHHCIVEMHGDIYMPHSHTCRCRKCSNCSFILKNNKKFRVCKTHI